MNKSKLNQQGQTFVAVVLLMVIALTVGVAVSARFVKTLRSVTTSDNSLKALHGAESGIERILLLPTSTLEDYITYNSCGADCAFSITDEFTGQIVTVTITLSYVGSIEGDFVMEVTPTETNQVVLNGYTSGSSVSVCWDTSVSIYAAYVFEQSGVIEQDTFAYNPETYYGEDNGFGSAAGGLGHENCFAVPTTNTPQLLRLKSVYSDATLYIIPAEGQTLPRQGILIESVGKASDTVRKVTVIRSDAATPGIFDYALYRRSATGALSN